MKPLRTVKGRVWVGLWQNGDLGFCLPPFAAHKEGEPLSQVQQEVVRGRSRTWASSDMYRVEITLRPVKDRRGRYIVRRAK